MDCISAMPAAKRFMDDVLMSSEGHLARVRRGRDMERSALIGDPMVGELQLIRCSDVIRVGDKPATL